MYSEIGDELNDNQKLWRYMDLSKFISLIEKESLWLARADTFRDKHEGRFPDEMRTIIKKAYDGFNDDSNSVVKDADDFQDYLRKNTFISCWHKNFDENMIMWEIYGKDTNAIAIQTTVKKILVPIDKLETTPYFMHSLMLKNVIYKRADEIKGALPYEECFFIKRPHFDFEKEVRISLDTYCRINPTKNTPLGHYLPVVINELIEKILIHPDSPDWFMGVIKSVIEKYDLHAQVERGLYGTH